MNFYKQKYLKIIYYEWGLGIGPNPQSPTKSHIICKYLNN